jgi:hypothetical protein
MIALLLSLLAQQSPEAMERARFTALEEFRRQPKPLPPEADAAYFEAQWEYGHALSRLAECRKQPLQWKQVISYWTAFIWERDGDLASLEARLLIARAHQALEDWGPCFANLKAARQLDTPDRRKNPDLADIATRALILEARARLAQGQGAEISLRDARAHLAQFPSDGEPTLALRLETARLLHAANFHLESRRVLEELLARHPRTDVGDEALVLLADLFGRRTDEAAERLFETRRHAEALVRFQRLPRTPHTWLRLGQAFAQSRRFLESADALGRACAVDSPDRVDAALELEKVLRHLAGRLGEPGAQARLDGHRAWMISTFGERIGPAPLFAQARSLQQEQKYREAADLYGRIPAGVDCYEDAVHSRAVCLYRLKEHAKALDLFRAYLAFDQRTPRSTDAAIDLAAWCLARLDRPAELLEHVDLHAPADPVRAQWRLAHRVDALARLARFDEAKETLGQMKEDIALDPTLRALERLAAGYEAAVRVNNDPKLWSAYARTALTLSEKSFKPLGGDKLLAAADAIYLEATPEAYGLAFELYSRVLAAAKLRPEEERPLDYRRAVAAAGSGRLERALQIADALTTADPYNGTYLELRADVLGLQADALPRSPERRNLMEAAVKAYGELSSAIRNRQGEAWFRLTWKCASRQLELDPDRVKQYFRIMEMKGYGSWDDGRWGYRAKMEDLRRKAWAP